MKKNRVFFLTALLTALILSFTAPFAWTARAAEPTDEIEHFIITVDVQEDASLLMTYHIDWKVLDDVTYGPLEWVNIGLPNSHHTDVTGIQNVSSITDQGSSLDIYLDRNYYEDEVASFEFSFVQDHMYQIDRYVEGETVFAYTPAWFDGIEVKDLTIRWNEDKAGAWQPDCVQDNGYLVFTSSLDPGERYSITVAYPNDAFSFSDDRQSDDAAGGGRGDYYAESTDDWPMIIIGFFAFIIMFVIPGIGLIKFFQWIFSGEGFGTSSEDTEKKIIRTKIEYYEFCPSCGAGRIEGKDECPYCGRSMIKSKEIVEEKDLDKPKNYSKAGTYHYGSDPNTYIHVNVVNVPVSHPGGSRRSGGSGRSGGSSGPVLPVRRPVHPAARALPAVRVPAHALPPAAPAALSKSSLKTAFTAAE